MKLPPALDNLHKIKHAKVIGVALAIGVNIGLILLNAFFPTEVGYYFLMIGTVAFTFLFLYLFGVRDGKWLASLGIIIFLIIGMVNGILIVHSYYSQDKPEPLQSSLFVDWETKDVTDIEDGNLTHGQYWYYIDNATLAPYESGPGTYNLRLTLHSNASFATPPDLRVRVIRFLWSDEEIPEMSEADSGDVNYLDGKVFEADVNITEEWIYFHGFALVFDATGTPSSLNTSLELGPLVGPESGLYISLAGIGMVSMFCNIGLLFLIVVLLYWWLGTAKEKRKQWQQELKDEEEGEGEIEEGEEDEEEEPSEEEEFTCTSCGSSVSASHNFCPQCGERFEGVEDEESSDDPVGDEQAVSGNGGSADGKSSTGGEK
jgi:hypothetical protein